MTNELLRLHEGGRISERVKFPGPVIACALSGTDRLSLPKTLTGVTRGWAYGK